MYKTEVYRLHINMCILARPGINYTEKGILLGYVIPILPSPPLTCPLSLPLSRPSLLPIPFPTLLLLTQVHRLHITLE